MSILSGFFKTKKYRKTSTGYKLQSEWTSGSTVEMADGNTAETNLGAIKGITSSLTATNANVALSASAGKSLQDQITEINSNLLKIKKVEVSTQCTENVQTDIAINPGFADLNNMQGYCINRVFGSGNTERITYCQMMSYDNIRVLSSTTQTVTVVVLYFYTSGA